MRIEQPKLFLHKEESEAIDAAIIAITNVLRLNSLHYRCERKLVKCLDLLGDVAQTQATWHIKNVGPDH